MKKFIDLRIHGYEPELIEFIRLCSWIQSLGQHGMSRTIKVHVDGDGSGRLLFEVIEGDKKDDLPSQSLQQMRLKDESEDGFLCDIGE